MMCAVNWTELRLWLSPAITAFGIFMSVLAAIYIPRNQKWRDRLDYANATSDILSDATARVWDRLEIRFDLPSYARTGRKMRQFRSDGAIATLKEIKVSDLPIDLVAAFSEARTGLGAINEAMNNETVWPPDEPDIERYRVVYTSVDTALKTLNRQSAALGTKRVKVPHPPAPTFKEAHPSST